jgi:hypothetical protein
MTSPRHAPHDGAIRSSTGPDPRRSDAVVRQRLRAVAGGARPAVQPSAVPAVTAGGRPVLDWRPATGAFAALAGPDAVGGAGTGDLLPRDAPAEEPAAAASPVAARPPADVAEPGAGWLPERPVAAGVHEPGPDHRGDDEVIGRQPGGQGRDLLGKVGAWLRGDVPDCDHWHGGVLRIR